MAKLILQGDYHSIRILAPGEGENPEDELYVAMCQDCDWSDAYDTLDDATEYSATHADEVDNPAL